MQSIMATWTSEGKELEACDLDLFNSSQFNLVIVSGCHANPCGHALLNIGGDLGYYVHIADWFKRPHFLDHRRYQDYLMINDKRELFRERIYLPYPNKALLQMERMLVDRWVWGVVVHNCSVFVEKILQAGGWHSSLSNCPVFNIDRKDLNDSRYIL